MQDQEQNPYEAPQAQLEQRDHEMPTGPVDAVFKRFFRLIGEDGGPSLYIWGILAIAGLPGQLLNVAAQQQMLSDFGSAAGMMLVMYALMFVVGILTYTSYRVLRVSEDRGGDLSFSEGISLALDRVVPTAITLFLYGLAVTVGMVFCLVPGIIAAFLLGLGPFICAVYDVPPVEALKTSFEWFKTHITIMMVWIGVAMVYGMAVGAISFAIAFSMGGAQTMASGTMGYIPTLIVWSLSSFAGYFMWVFTGSAFLTVGRAEEQYMSRPDPFR